MKPDLTSESVPEMVDAFYNKVQSDDLLAPIFGEFAGVNWEVHLPKMYNFWRTILFGDGDFKGSPFDKHIPLPVNAEHFDRWLKLFNETIDELFEGQWAKEIKLRASTIAWTFQSKLEHLKNRED